MVGIVGILKGGRNIIITMILLERWSHSLFIFIFYSLLNWNSELTVFSLQVQWTRPKADQTSEESSSTPVSRAHDNSTVAAGPAVSAVRSLAAHPDMAPQAPNDDQLVTFTSPQKSIAQTAPSSSETVGLLQSLFPYYSYDQNTASLVQMTIPSLQTGEIDGRDDLGNTLLLLAIQYKAHDCMEQLIRIGADVNARNYSGSCALHYACHFETFNQQTIRMLISNGAKPNFAEEAAQGGLTPLHYAAETGNVETCKFLVSKGADPSKRDAYGRTPADCARDAGQSECAAALASIMSSTPSKNSTIPSSAAKMTPVAAPSWGFGEDSSEIKEMLLNIQADLQRALSSKEVQRQEYETLIREKELALTRKGDRVKALEAEQQQLELKLEHGRVDLSSLEKKVSELVSQLSSASAALEEEKRGRIASVGRAERRCMDMEAQVSAEAKRYFWDFYFFIFLNWAIYFLKYFYRSLLCFDSHINQGLNMKLNCEKLLMQSSARRGKTLL
jgi:uncharacterized protein